jgi:hypothetical protein
MDKEKRRFAEKTLQRLFVGSIVGRGPVRPVPRDDHAAFCPR